MTRVVLAFAVRTVNEANSHQHWRSRQRRAKLQRAAVRAHVMAAIFGKMVRADVSRGLAITVTRVAPSSGLDAHDGLPASVKHIVDGIADAFGLPDNDPRFAWGYGQERGPYGVRVEIVSSQDPSPAVPIGTSRYDSVKSRARLKSAGGVE